MGTPNIVPRADGEGSLGTPTKQWLDVQAKTINGKSLVTTATADSIPITGATGKLDASLLGSHTHSYAPIPTSSALPVGAMIVGKAESNTTNGSTIAGSKFKVYICDRDGCAATGGAQAGTWKNISGTTIRNHEYGLFVRTA